MKNTIKPTFSVMILLCEKPDAFVDRFTHRQIARDAKEIIAHQERSETEEINSIKKFFKNGFNYKDNFIFK